MPRAISNKNVADAKFNPAPFDGPFKASLGCPELKGSWLIFGKSGSGKTTFALQLAKYLTRFVDKVAFDSLEPGSVAVDAESLEARGHGGGGFESDLPGQGTPPGVAGQTVEAKSPNSGRHDLGDLPGRVRLADYQKLMNDYPDKLFIFLAHEDDRGNPWPALAEKIRKLSDIKMRVEGYRVYTTTRYEDRTKGEGGEDFTIWEEGAAEYDAKL